MDAIITTKQTLPTYLKEFLREEAECILVHTKAPWKKTSTLEAQEEWNFSSQLKLSLNLNSVSMESELDLTGSPLHVDLDESVIVVGPSVSKYPPNWTVAESQHFPLDLNDARDLLNSMYNCKKTTLPTFCVTNAKDKLKTVVIGSHYTENAIITYLGQILGVYSYNDEEFSVENLKFEHFKYVRVKADSIQYNFMRVYNIHGYSIQDTPALEYSKYNGCIFLETYWNIFSKEEPAINETRMKLIVKVISGHKESDIHFMWKQLGYLWNYLNILSDTDRVNNGDTSLSEDYLSISDITANIHELCNINLRKKRKMNVEVLDYSDLREMSILDNVWMLLNRCQNLKDLRSSLSTFFKIVNFENYRSNEIILSIRKCLENNIDYISQLTYAEALKLLVYIGFEKVKEDYLTITNFFYPIHQGLLEKKWSELHCHDEESTRKITGLKNYGINDTSFNEQKMTFLLRLHDTAEMLTFFDRQVKTSSEFSSDNFGLICKQIFEKNILNQSIEKGEVGMKVKLVDITCDLNRRNYQIYKNKVPLDSIYDITSKVHKCTIKTVFHISQVPLFPTSIYDNYGIDDKSITSEDAELHQLLYKSMLLVREKKMY